MIFPKKQLILTFSEKGRSRESSKDEEMRFKVHQHTIQSISEPAVKEK